MSPTQELVKKNVSKASSRNSQNIFAHVCACVTEAHCLVLRNQSSGNFLKIIEVATTPGESFTCLETENNCSRIEKPWKYSCEGEFMLEKDEGFQL